MELTKYAKCTFAFLVVVSVIYIVTQPISKMNWTYLQFLPFVTINNAPNATEYILQWNSPDSETPLVTFNNTPNVTKNILLWNSPDRIETSAFGIGHEAFIDNNCPVTQCEIFVNRTALPFNEYDAVVMNMHEIHLTTMPETEGFNRSQHQRYVFLTQESPTTMPMNPVSFLQYFNWSMTYKLDSDVLLVYGRVKPKASAPKNSEEVDRRIKETHGWTRNYAANKNKTVVWMVSHCDTNSLRETYVKELSKYIEVDIYGGCGNLSCARNNTHWLSEPQCYDLLAGQYKFYLSFENSVCSDYVTEKFFNILTKDLVPVVYGGADYGALAPAHSFVDAMRWTPRQLADHLRLLAANDTLYNEFFWWKDHYHVEAGVEQMARHGFCDLCRKLHEDSSVKVYENIKMEWSRLTQCKTMASWLTSK